MKTIITVLCCLYMLLGTFAFIYGAWSLDQSAIAMRKLAEDNRDIFPKLYEIEQRANYELGQIARDRIRIRDILKRLEGKVNGTKPSGAGGTKRDPGRPD